MKLYGFGPTRSLRAQWALRELGAEFEFIPVNLAAGEGQTPEFLRLNPAGKLPVLVDGDLILTESAAIVFYLAEKYPGHGLLPSDLETRAQVYRWALFAMTELEQPLWRMARHTFLYPKTSACPPTSTWPAGISATWQPSSSATWKAAPTSSATPSPPPTA
ncbi:glutathione S-transferase family protein [Luteimonas suaedae]|uniref:glutathione S-transferase family protein n=1 Tax=Luteimonas suaedae TaxID=2605430 RepID=UPI001CA7FF2F|nr:glutathione S-transferase [Luteimonas suaedae]